MNYRDNPFREHYERHIDEQARIRAAKAKMRYTPRYSDLIAAAAGRQMTNEAEAAAELSARAAEIAGHPSRGGHLLPWSELVVHRDLNVGTSTAGGYLQTSSTRPDLIGALRPRSAAAAAGATIIPAGVAGSVIWPRLSTGADFLWVNESGSHESTGPTFDNVTVPPRTAAATIDFSRQLAKMGLSGANGIDRAIRDELVVTIMNGVDADVFNGTGVAPEPEGILANADITVEAIGTNGGAPTWDLVTAMEATVGAANGDLGAPAWAMNSATRRKLRRTEKFSGTGREILEGATLCGHPVVASEHLPSDLDKGTSTGVCSALVFGDFSAVLLPVWGAGLDLIVNPATRAHEGIVTVTALLDIGIGLRHPSAFVSCKDILTT